VQEYLLRAGEEVGSVNSGSDTANHIESLLSSFSILRWNDTSTSHNSNANISTGNNTDTTSGNKLTATGDCDVLTRSTDVCQVFSEGIERVDIGRVFQEGIERADIGRVFQRMEESIT